jgi:hypothetical protein
MNVSGSGGRGSQGQPLDQLRELGGEAAMAATVGPRLAHQARQAVLPVALEPTLRRA